MFINITSISVALKFFWTCVALKLVDDDDDDDISELVNVRLRETIL